MELGRGMITTRCAVLQLAMLLLLAPQTAADGEATAITFVNLCTDTMKLYNGFATSSTRVAAGDSVTFELPDGDNAAYRYGSSFQATQAEFTVDGSRTWYDISIIPSGPNSGPGTCTSLEDCKDVTGGVGFNVAMQIVPRSGGDTSSSATCRVLSCLEDGCDDAYTYPEESDRTHSCSSSVAEFEVIFCPSDASASGSASAFWVDVDASSSNSSNSAAASNSSAAENQERAQAEAKIFSTESSRAEFSRAESSHVKDASQAVRETNSASSFSSQSASGSNESETTSTGSSGVSTGSKAAIYVASALAVAVIGIGAAVYTISNRQRLRELWAGVHWRQRRSSDTFFFVRTKDASTS